MHTSAAWSLLAGLVLTAAPLQAQHVDARVIVRSRPVAGQVVIRDGYSTYRRPVYRRPVVRRVVVVERVHRHRPAKHWSRRGYRPVTLYYWEGRYYDRRIDDGRGVRTVVVWERDGRYYRDCDDRDFDRHWDH
jgi:hypothetical protein